jgi:hypothetical protein
MIVPVGNAVSQSLKLVTKDYIGNINVKSIEWVRFVK